MNKLLDAYLELDPRDREEFLDNCRRRWPRLSRWFVILAGESRTATSLLTEIPEKLAAQAVQQFERAPLTRLEAGTQLGPWRVIEHVGAGGMGAVYRGERADGAFEMQVAIKLIGSRAPGLVEHLNRECRLLARLDHVAVTRLVDAGLTDVREPFLVMEWVAGADLDDWLKANDCSIEARLRLFDEVAAAVSHAHQRLVVHGDIKPGNIRVRSDGQVKLMDFGVATLLKDTGDDEPRLAAMTPAYAAPEQRRREPPGTRSDIWSLGALLYWLIVGEPPARDDGSPREDELKACPRPWELRAILRKAMAEDPEQRYDSVQSLVDDLIRYREDRPITAISSSRSMQMVKFVRRNKWLVGAVGGVVILLAGAATVSTLLYLQAAAERERAERHAQEIELVARFQEQQLSEIDTSMMGVNLRESLFQEKQRMLEELEVADFQIRESIESLEHLLAGINFTDLALDWLDSNILEGAVDSIGEQFADRPLVRARLLQSVANTKRNLALYERALPLQEEVLEIRRRELGADAPETLESMNRKALLLRSQGQFSESESYARRVLEARRRVLGNDHPDTLHAASNLGVLLSIQGRLAEAEPYYLEALEGRRRVLGPEDPDTLTSISNTGVFLVRKGDLEEAESYMREALELRRRVLGDNDRATLQSINNLAVVLSRQEKLDEAEDFYLEALERSRQVRGNDHPSTLDIVNNVGALLYRKERYAEAEPYIREALEGSRRVLGEFHPSTIGSIHNLGRVSRELGRLAEAEQHGSLALTRAREVMSPGHWQTAMFAVSYARTLAELEEFTRAERLMLEAHEVYVDALGSDHYATIQMMEAFAEIYDAWHQSVPGGGHAESRDRWLARIDAVRSEGEGDE